MSAVITISTRLGELRVLPSDLAEAFFPQKNDSRDGVPMKFLETESRDTEDVWRPFALYDGKAAAV